MMHRTRTFVAALTIAIPLSAQAAGAHQGSMEDQMACTPDVYRLCASQVPDEDAIVACLKQNRAVLSPACGRVFARPDKNSSTSSDVDTD